jgi:hypothetical protein
MTTATNTFRAFGLLLIGVLALASGCGGTPGAADAESARQTLIAALDAWKSGQTPDALAARSPAIHVSDTDWNSGATLTNYEAADSAVPAGYDLSFSVVLELRGPKAKVPTKSNAVYVVSTHPKALVLRQDAPSQ